MTGREHRRVGRLRAALRVGRLTRRQRRDLDALLSIVANEDASLLGMAFTSGRETGR